MVAEPSQRSPSVEECSRSIVMRSPGAALCLWHRVLEANLCAARLADELLGRAVTISTSVRAFSPEDCNDAMPDVLAEITRTINPVRRHRSCPRAAQTRPPQQLPGQETRRAQHPPRRPPHQHPRPDTKHHDQLKLRGIGTGPRHRGDSCSQPLRQMA